MPARPAASKPLSQRQGFGSCLPDAWAEARTVVVVAHPDDEILGCGCLLGALNDVRIVHVTDGAPRGGAEAARLGRESADYARMRRREAEAALALAGLSAEYLTGLGIADQEASLNLVPITRALRPLLWEADLILTHAFEGGHSDHDAVAFAVHAACRGAAAALVEMPFYHADEDGWVRQTFLPWREAGPEWVLRLDAAERDLKARMVAAHRTQAETLRSFGLDEERFRRAPEYNFRLRPHSGPLLYERHGWNLTWPQWEIRVATAEAALDRDDRPCR